MLIPILAAVLAAPLPVPPPIGNVATVVAADHGKLAWFEGSYEEALEKAAASKQLVFIDFWTDW